MKKLLFVFLLFLGSCGFSPLYQELSSKGSDVSVQVSPISGKFGATMRQTILSKMGQPSDVAKYELIVIAPTFTSWDQTIDNKNFSSLIGLTIHCNYVLVEKESKKTVLKDSATLSSSYSVVQDPYMTTVAERKAKQELAKQLAEQISMHVLSVLSGENS